MKKVLMVATVPSMIGQFNMSNILILQKLGYEVHVACDFLDRSVWTDKKVKEFKKKIDELNIQHFQIYFSRSITKVRNHIKSYRQMVALLNMHQYDFIHCHTPIGGAISRLAAHKTQTKVIYTAHGFHFFRGAPIKNWILFYPVEKFLSKYTDIIITINKEDYERAHTFSAKQVSYIPGVGLDTSKFNSCDIDKQAKRRELGIPKDAIVLLSVGELSIRKNHMVVINALGKLKDKNIYYLIVGIGELKKQYFELSKKWNISEQVKLLGQRSDIDELCKISDVFVHPSIREGLGMAALEGMAAGLPIISSYVNGIKDYTEDGKSGCCVQPMDVNGFVEAICKMVGNPLFRKKCSIFNLEHVKKFDIKNTDQIMVGIYGNI